MTAFVASILLFGQIFQDRRMPSCSSRAREVRHDGLLHSLLPLLGGQSYCWAMRL